MSGLAIVSPLSFGDESLPRVDVSPVPSLRGALYDWSTDNLGIGDRVTHWTDRASHVTLDAPAVPSQAPVVVDDTNHGKLLRFNGVNQRIDAHGLSLSGPRTLVLVGRLPSGGTSEYFLTNGTIGTQFNLGINGAGTWLFYNGTGLSNPNRVDTDMHVFTVVIDGDRSVVSVDGRENGGELGTTTANSLRLGASGSEYYQVDFKRLVILPYAASPYERESIHTAMTERYL